MEPFGDNRPEAFCKQIISIFILRIRFALSKLNKSITLSGNWIITGERTT